MGTVYFQQPSVPSGPKEGKEGEGTVVLKAFLPLLSLILACFAIRVRPLTKWGANEHFASVYMRFRARVYLVCAESLQSL